MRFTKKKEEGAGIPTASMADIAFLLILFFMVTTIFRVFAVVELDLPQVEMGNKLRNESIAYLFVTTKERITINDKLLDNVEQVSTIMSVEMAKDPSTIVSLRIDREAKYNIVGDIFDQLSEAKALRVSLATEKRRG
jgi:biopolymer transport protein ExbD